MRACTHWPRNARAGSAALNPCRSSSQEQQLVLLLRTLKATPHPRGPRRPARRRLAASPPHNCCLNASTPHRNRRPPRVSGQEGHSWGLPRPLRVWCGYVECWVTGFNDKIAPDNIRSPKIRRCAGSSDASSTSAHLFTSPVSSQTSSYVCRQIQSLCVPTPEKVRSTRRSATGERRAITFKIPRPSSPSWWSGPP